MFDVQHALATHFPRAAADARMFASQLFASQAAQEGGMFDVVALGKLVISSLIFVAIGLLVFLVAFWCITKITPFSIRKEIEEDQNTALGIVIGSVIIGLALIISAAIRG
jgi:putative membrane protein